MSARAAATSPAATRGKPATRKVRLTPRAGALLFLVFLIGMVAIAPTRGYLDQRGRLEDLERQATALEQQNEQLRLRIADFNDPRTLERLARECLGMVRPGEIGFVIIPKGEPPIPLDCG